MDGQTMALHAIASAKVSRSAPHAQVMHHQGANMLPA